MGAEFRTKLEKIMAIKAGENVINADAFANDIRDSIRAQLAIEGMPNPLQYVNVLVFKNEHKGGYTLKVVHAESQPPTPDFVHFFERLGCVTTAGSFTKNPLNGMKSGIREYFADTPEDLILGINQLLTSSITKIDPCQHIIGFLDKYPDQFWQPAGGADALQSQHAAAQGQPALTQF